MSINKDIHLSLVSHGQLSLIDDLLHDLAKLACCERFQLTLTLNIKETANIDFSTYPFAINIIENTVIKGFGENHNNAFEHAPCENERKYFFVINPDVRIEQDIFSSLVSHLELNPKAGVIAPSVVNNKEELEDSSRILPTPWLIIKKVFGYQSLNKLTSIKGISEIDWVAGMFMGFREDVFKNINGFDIKFFLYYEDVDICSRLWLKGFQVKIDPTLRIIHNAQRESHRRIKYFKWHITSLLLFFLSSVYRHVKKLHNNRSVSIT